MIKIKLINTQAPTKLQEIELQPETMLNKECLIGRSPSCSLVLESAEVSRLHGKIFFQDGKYFFADLASSGGSWLNDEHVKVNQGYLLKLGDIIRVGNFMVMIVGMALAEEPTMVVLPSDDKTEIILPNTNGQATESLPPTPLVINTPVVKQPQEYMPVAMIDPNQLSRWTKGDLKVRCVRVIEETSDAKTFCFVAEPPVLFTYKPGQFVTLDLEINGEEVLRSYSISSTPSRPHTLEVTVKRVPPPPEAEPHIPAGKVSNWLHHNIKPGTEIKLTGPLGKFTCFANPSQKLLFISAGSGITPMMSMSRWLIDTVSDCNIVFFHSARSPRDIIFRQELELMSARYPNFNLAVTTTRKDLGQSWLGLTGRINPAMLEMVAPDFKERTVYVCGPNQFMEGVKQMLESIGFPMQNYYEESFGTPRKEKKSPPVQTNEQAATPAHQNTPVNSGGLRGMFNRFIPQSSVSPAAISTPTPTPVSSPTPVAASSSQCTVVFSKSGKQVAADGEEPILNIAELEGVKIRSSCRSGTCGSCKKRKLEGEVNMGNYDPEALEDSERQEGYILTCISYPVGKVVIDA